MADRKADARRTTSKRRRLQIVGDSDGDDGPAFTLYSTEKLDGSTLKAFFGMLDSRRAAAREAISMVLRHADEKTPADATALDDLRVRHEPRDAVGSRENPPSTE